MFRRDQLLTSVSAIVIFAVILLWWILRTPSYTVSERVPGMDGRPPKKQISDSVLIGEYFESFGEIDETAPGSWPRFRGADFDNISKDPTPLAEKWDTSGPPVVWEIALGEGYAGPAVHRGRVYVLDYNEKLKADMLRCFSLKTGRELWRRWYNVEFKRNHGYSRTIPAITDNYVVTIGPRSHVMCVDALSGSLLWTIDMEKMYGIPGNPKGIITPEFYNGQCPLIDNGMVILAPGGKTLMTGIDIKSGKVLWSTPNYDSVRMSHTSIMPMIIQGKRMYVYHSLGAIYGISAEKEDIGKVIWKTSKYNPSIAVASPVYLGNNEIAVFGSYGAGGARIKVNRDFSTEVTEIHKSPEGIATEQHTPILYNGYLWVVLSENAGSLKRQLACYSTSDLLKPVWTSGRELRFGKGMGPYIISGNKLYHLDDEGTLHLFRVDKNKAELVSSHKVMEAVEAWAPMAIAGRYLILRDAHKMICLDIGVKN